jgi:hypothetical protein
MTYTMCAGITDNNICVDNGNECVPVILKNRNLQPSARRTHSKAVDPRKLCIDCIK